MRGWALGLACQAPEALGAPYKPNFPFSGCHPSGPHPSNPETSLSKSTDGLAQLRLANVGDARVLSFPEERSTSSDHANEKCSSAKKDEAQWHKRKRLRDYMLTKEGHGRKRRKHINTSEKNSNWKSGHAHRVVFSPHTHFQCDTGESLFLLVYI